MKLMGAKYIRRHHLLTLLLLLSFVIIVKSSHNTLAQVEDAAPSYVASVAWSPDAVRVAVSHGPLDACDAEDNEPTIDILNMATGELLDQITLAPGCAAPALAWNNDGSRLIVTGSPGRPSAVWNMVLNPTFVAESEEASGIQAVDEWSPDGTRVARVSLDSELQIWDSRRGAALTTCCNDEDAGSPLSLSWSPGTANLVIGYEDGKVSIWDSREYRVLAQLGGHEADVRAVAFSRDGQKIATADWDGFIQIWDGLTGELLQQLQDENHTRIRVASWSPNGEQLATAGEDGTVHIWDVLAGEDVRAIQSTGTVYDVDWSPDGTRIVYGGESEDGQGLYKFILAPIPNRCDTVVEAGDVEGLSLALVDANTSPSSELICLTESTYTFAAESVTALFDADGLNALPSLSRSVTINGRGAVLERDPNSEIPFRFFHIDSTGALLLNNLTLIGGLAGEGEDGGAVLNKGTFTAINTTFENNAAESGGAISHGGVIATIVESNFTSNAAARDDGGAITNSGSAMEIIDSTFFDNSASDNGGSIDNDAGIARINGGIFSFNSAGDDGGAVSSGGQLIITDVLFRLNNARDDGGAIYIDDTGSAALSRVSFTRNSASDEGGGIANDGILNVSSSCFNNNTSVDFSGVAGFATGTTIADNWWGSATGPALSDEDNDGGAVGEELQFEPFLVEMPVYCDVE